MRWEGGDLRSALNVPREDGNWLSGKEGTGGEEGEGDGKEGRKEGERLSGEEGTGREGRRPLQLGRMGGHWERVHCSWGGGQEGRGMA